MNLKEYLISIGKIQDETEDLKLSYACKTFYDCNILKAEITENGFKGGDAGHGGFVSLKLTDLASTCIEINGVNANTVEITVRGDSERRTLIEALKFFIKSLE